MMPNPFRMVNPFLPADEGPPENPFRAATAKAVFGDDSFIQTPAPTESVVPGRLEARLQETGITDPIGIGKQLLAGGIRQAGMMAGGAAGMADFAGRTITGTPAAEALNEARDVAHKVHDPIAGFADRTLGKPASPMEKIADFLGPAPVLGELAKVGEASELVKGVEAGAPEVVKAAEDVRPKPVVSDAELAPPEPAANPFREPSTVTLHTPGAVVGAAVGGTAGSKADEKNPGRGMLLGALTGAVVGAGANKLMKGIASKPGVADDAISEALGAKKAFTGEVNPDEFVNVSKFALDPSGEARLRGEVDRVVREKGLAPKQKITWEETKALASSMGLDKIDGKVGRLDGPKMLAIRNIVSQNVEALDGLYKKLNTGGLDRGAMGEVDGQIAVLEKQNDALLSRFVKARTQTGRDLNNLKILASRTMDPVTWLTKAQNLVEQGGRGLSPVERQTITDLTKSGDRGQLVKYIAGLRPTSVGEKVTTLWKAGLLTGLKTQEANFLGNVSMAALETAKDAPAAIMDRLLGVVSKQRTKSFSVARTARASWKGAMQGAKEAKLVMQGIPMDDALKKYDLPKGEVDFGNPILNGYTRGVFRSLEASDRVFRGIALQRSLAEQLALNGGKLTDEVALNAVRDAEYATFKTRTPLPGSTAREDVLSKGAAKFKQAVGGPAEAFMPFSSTPSNVASRIVEYSPLGAIKTGSDIVKFVRAVAKDLPAGEIARLQKVAAESAGRTVVGGVAPVTAGYMLAANGKMTGARPASPTERATWDLEGKQENSVLINGKWWSLTRISPIGNLMALGANLYNFSHHPGATPGQVAGAAAGSIGTTLTEQSFLSGVQDATEAVKDPVGAGGRYFQNLAGSVVPTIVRNAAQAQDPTVRQPRSFSEAFKARLPGKSQEVPAKVDQFGKEATREGGIGAFVDPFTARPDKRNDPVIKELDRIGATIGELRRKDMETDAEYQARKKEDGQRLYDRLLQVINHPRYKALPDEVKRDELESEIAKARSHYTRQRRHRSAA